MAARKTEARYAARDEAIIERIPHVDPTKDDTDFDAACWLIEQEPDSTELLLMLGLALDEKGFAAIPEVEVEYLVLEGDDHDVHEGPPEER